MNILINVSYGAMFTVAPEHTAALVALLPHLRKVESSGYGESLTYAVSELPPEASFIDSARLSPPSATELALQKELEKKNEAWVSAFTERDRLKAELDALRSAKENVA